MNIETIYNLGRLGTWVLSVRLVIIVALFRCQFDVVSLAWFC